eukprot:scaffold80145_cov44-Phaeocystis_antarctica.AAC.1
MLSCCRAAAASAAAQQPPSRSHGLHSSEVRTAAAGRPRRPASDRPSTHPSSALGKLRAAHGRARRYQLELQRGRRACPRDHYLV